MSKTSEQEFDDFLSQLDHYLGLRNSKGEAHQIVDEIMGVLKKRGFHIFNKDYQRAYHQLMEYWDSIPDEIKEDVHKELNRIGV